MFRVFLSRRWRQDFVMSTLEVKCKTSSDVSKFVFLVIRGGNVKNWGYWPRIEMVSYRRETNRESDIDRVQLSILFKVLG